MITWEDADKRVQDEAFDAMQKLAKNILWRIAKAPENDNMEEAAGAWFHEQLDSRLQDIRDAVHLAASFSMQELEGWAEEGRVQWDEAVEDWARETGEYAPDDTDAMQDAFAEALSDGKAGFDAYVYACRRCGAIEISEPDYWLGHSSADCTSDDDDEREGGIVMVPVHADLSAEDIWQGIMAG